MEDRPWHASFCELTPSPIDLSTSRNGPPNWSHRLFEFAKQRATVQQVENFVVDDTPFFATHYRKVLVELESDGGLNYLKSPAGRRSGTYADKMVLLEFS